MQTLTVEEAQAKLPDLIEQVEAGGVVVITKDAKPVAQIVQAQRPRPVPVFGSGRGMMTIVADDEEHLADFAEYMP